MKQLYTSMQKIIIHNFKSFFSRTINLRMLRLTRVYCPISLKRYLDIGKILFTLSFIYKSISFNIIVIISDSFVFNLNPKWPLSTEKRHSPASTPSGIHLHFANTKLTPSAHSTIVVSESAPLPHYYISLFKISGSSCCKMVTLKALSHTTDRHKNKPDAPVATVPKKKMS